MAAYQVDQLSVNDLLPQRQLRGHGSARRGFRRGESRRDRRGRLACRSPARERARSPRRPGGPGYRPGKRRAREARASSKTAACIFQTFGFMDEPMTARGFQCQGSTVEPHGPAVAGHRTAGAERHNAPAWTGETCALGPGRVESGAHGRVGPRRPASATRRLGIRRASRAAPQASRAALRRKGTARRALAGAASSHVAERRTQTSFWSRTRAALPARSRK